MNRSALTVFTKPWKSPDVESLARLIRRLGFDGVELTVRPGYQVEPESVLRTLPQAMEVFSRYNLQIESIAAEPTESVIEACSEAGITMIRTMLPIDPAIGYRASVGLWRKSVCRLDDLLYRTGVRIGVQNHCDNFVGTACGLMEALDGLSEHFVAVLDFAHTAITGEPDRYALELAQPRLAMVNLKNVVYSHSGNRPNGEARWLLKWVTAREGLSSWSRVVELLRNIQFTGPICLTAQYSDQEGRPMTERDVLPLIQEDLVYLRELLSETT